MKIECGKESIGNAIVLAEKISGRNLTLPVLNCLLLSVKKNTFSVKATNLDLGIEVSVPCKVFEDGVIAVPSSIFSNTILSLQNTELVSLESENDNLTVKTRSGKTTIKALPYEDFPTLPLVEGGGSHSIEADVFIRGFQAVWYSASLSAVKPELGSVYVYGKGKKILFVATDSFRLAEKIIPKDIPDSFGSFLIPFRNVPEIIRVLERAEGDTTVAWNDHQISFSFDKVYLTSRLVNGSFPDYKEIIPKETTTEAIVLKQDIITTLKKTTIFSDKFNQIRFKIEPKKKQFTVYSQNADVGETTDSVPAALSGDPLDIAFNHKYLTDCFPSINADSVSLNFAGVSRPLVIRGVSDPSFLYLVMPMNK